MHRTNSPSPDTQKPRLAENHIVIHPTIRKRLETYPLGRTRPTATCMFRIRRTQCARLRRSDGSHARRMRCIGGGRRREVCEVGERGQDVCAPEEAFAVAEKTWGWPWGLGEVCAKDLGGVSVPFRAGGMGGGGRDVPHHRRLERLVRSLLAALGIPPLACIMCLD
jgi:hypothetical protein